MISLILLIVIGYIIWILFGQFILLFIGLIGALIVALLAASALFLVYSIGVHLLESLRLFRAKVLLNQLTTPAYLNQLNEEQRKNLIALNEEYTHNKTAFIKRLKDSAFWIALGYTATDLGFTRSLRYSLGYYGLRKVVRDKFQEPRK